MLNYIWAFMILIGVVYGAFTGKMAEVTSAALDSAGDAVSLCITMIGVMALWVGLMEIAQKSGLIAKLTRGIQPFISFLFPRIPKGHPAREYIATNLIANVLGLGWACTPAGLKAMEELAKLEEERGTPGYLADGGERRQMLSRQQEMEREEYGSRKSGAEKDDVWAEPGGLQSVGKKGKRERVASNEMCTFLILNISSLQLIPVNMIAYRSQYGSVNPAGIISPAIVATFISTLTAVVYCKGKDWKRRV
ncbi:MAG: nucleoside recognition protein [Lachnospiraceae bacterium]|nr:nucleoside recognition protein [Lachnospiraceae bacterium]